MENYEGFFGALTVGVLRVGLKPSTTIQLVVSCSLSCFRFDSHSNRIQSINDIGCVAAAVFKVTGLETPVYTWLTI